MKAKIIPLKVKIIPLVLLLAGCGGGGGGSGENTRELSLLEQARVLPYPLIEAANTRASQNPPYMSNNEPDAFRADFYPDFNTSDIRPLRGIVHSNEPAYVTTEFDDTHVKVHVDPVDTPDFTFDTATDSVDDRLARTPPGFGNADGFSPAAGTAYPAVVADWFVPGQSVKDVTVLQNTEEQTVYGRVRVSWDDDDPTNYLAGGTWTHLRGDLTEGLNTSIISATVGAYIDGPELLGTPTLPVSGEATYRGHAAGQYTFFYANDWDVIPLPEGAPRPHNGTWDTGIYNATIELVANFARNTISGCLGCELLDVPHNLLITDTAGNARYPNGELHEVFATYSAIYNASRVRFGETPIHPDGTFSGNDAYLEIDYYLAGASSSGTWGGKFSTIQDADGDPRLVVGTSAVDWSHPVGGRAMFVGHFVAGKKTD